MLFLVDEEVNQGRRLPPRLAYNLFFYGTLGSAPSVCLVSSPIDLISSLSYLVYLLPVDERRRRRLLVLLSIGSCSVDSFAWLLTSESVRVQFVSSFIPCTRSSLRLEPHHSSDRIYIQLMVCWWWWWVTLRTQGSGSGIDWPKVEVRNKCLTCPIYNSTVPGLLLLVCGFLTVILPLLRLCTSLDGRCFASSIFVWWVYYYGLCGYTGREQGIKETNDPIRRPF